MLAFKFILKLLRALLVDRASQRADVLLAGALYEHILGVKFSSRPGSAGYYTQVETAGGLTGLMQNQLLRGATVREAQVWDAAATERIAAAAERVRVQLPAAESAGASATTGILQISEEEAPLGLGLLSPGSNHDCQSWLRRKNTRESRKRTTQTY